MLRVALIVAAILACVLSAAPARAFEYTIVDLGTLTQTNLNQYSAGSDINDQGQGTGFVFDGSAGQHPYLWDGGPMQDIGSLVGSASGPDGNGGSFSHAALWQANATIVISAPRRWAAAASHSTSTTRASWSAPATARCYGPGRTACAT